MCIKYKEECTHVCGYLNNKASRFNNLLCMRLFPWHSVKRPYDLYFRDSLVQDQEQIWWFAPLWHSFSKTTATLNHIAPQPPTTHILPPSLVSQTIHILHHLTTRPVTHLVTLLETHTVLRGCSTHIWMEWQTLNLETHICRATHLEPHFKEETREAQHSKQMIQLRPIPLVGHL